MSSNTTLNRLQAQLHQLLATTARPFKAGLALLRALIRKLRTPGPTVAKFTSLWALVHQLRGSLGVKLRSLHLRCGTLVQFGPGLFSVSDGAYFKKLSKLDRSAHPISPPAFLALQDALMANVFTREHMIGDCNKKAVILLAKAHHDGIMAETNKVLTRYAYDVMIATSTGEDGGFLDQPTDAQKIDTELTNWKFHSILYGSYLQFHPLISTIRRSFGLDKTSTILQSASPACLTTDSAFSLSNIDARIALVLAGADPTIHLLSKVLGHMYADKTLLQRMQAEVSKAGIPQPPIFRDLIHGKFELQLLHAVLQECIRMYPADITSMYQSPEGGFPLGDSHIPSGATIILEPTSTAHVSQSHFGEEALTWNVIKWLSAERVWPLKKRMLAFGSSSSSESPSIESFQILVAVKLLVHLIPLLAAVREEDVKESEDDSGIGESLTTESSAFETPIEESTTTDGPAVETQATKRLVTDTTTNKDSATGNLTDDGTTSPAKVNGSTVTDSTITTESSTTDSSRSTLKVDGPSTPPTTTVATPTHVKHEHMDSLANIIGADSARAILTRFDPKRSGLYPKRLGGLYTPTIAGNLAKKAHDIIDIIYPRAPHGVKDRIWHSTNYETNQIWVGIPHSLPPQDKKKHNRRLHAAHEIEARLARQKDRANQLRQAINSANARPQQDSAPTAGWGSFVVDKNVELTAHQSKEAAEKRKAEMDARLARPSITGPPLPPATFTLNKCAPVVAAPPRPKPTEPFVPLHVKILRAREAAAAAAIAAVEATYVSQHILQRPDSPTTSDGNTGPDSARTTDASPDVIVPQAFKAVLSTPSSSDTSSENGGVALPVKSPESTPAPIEAAADFSSGDSTS